jgi:hypothetical protein
LIDGFFEKGPGARIVNEKTFVFDVNIIVENGVRRSVGVDDKSPSIECNRGQAHRIEGSSVLVAPASHDAIGVSKLRGRTGVDQMPQRLNASSKNCTAVSFIQGAILSEAVNQ